MRLLREEDRLAVHPPCRKSICRTFQTDRNLLQCSHQEHIRRIGVKPVRYFLRLRPVSGVILKLA
ncbi:MAG: hypothetical protein EBZ36_08930 [Acidobacteria bacterium]|nr:hypothetical protein [Acidobacteriota bacterium]